MVNSALVSVGFPVYNGGEELSRALDALLAQTYPNFELIVSDNASTDGTWEVCQEYAARDDRMHLCRNAENLGASHNFSRVFDLASGEYFMWAAHDDYWHPEFLKTAVAALEAQPSASLCYTDQLFIDAKGSEERTQRYQMDLDNPRCWRRAYSLLTHKPTPYAIIYGLFRRAALQAAFPYPTVAAADLVLLLHVILEGPFVHVPIVLYHRKVHLKSRETRMRVLLPNRRFTSPPVLFAELLITYWKIILRSGETRSGKLMMMWGAIRFVVPRTLFETFIRPIRNMRT